jgi:hypothetical protein
VRPDVLANGEADAVAGVVDDGGRVGGLEVAVFVEDIVGGQQAFAAHGDDGAPVAKGGGVVERASLAVGFSSTVPSEGGHGAGGGGDLGERFGHVAHEAPLEEQVARRIAAHTSSGKDHELRALGDEGGVGFEDLAAVAGEIADGGIELGEAEAHENERSGNVWCFSDADNSQRRACAVRLPHDLLSLSFP